MHTDSKTFRILGLAFLLQFITSFTSGMIMKLALTVTGNIGETMLKIANNTWLMRVNILGDILTAAGVIFLGVMLYITLRQQSEILALVGLGLYILEGAMLAASRIEAFSLLRISQEYLAAGQPAALLMTGSLAFESANFAFQAGMLAFCIGGLLFYYLLDKARIVPRFLSLWGLIAVLPCLVGTLAQFFGSSIPFYWYLPYVPFELVIGLWLLIKAAPTTRPE
jgi:hypothetical protein